MNKLIVDTKNAPFKNVAGILATWSKVAELVEQKAVLPEGCELEWELVFQHVSYRGNVLAGITGAVKPEDVADCWEAYGAVRMIFHARVGSINDKQVINVPLTEVGEVMINDNGTFFWHSNMAKPEDDPNTIERLAKAVSEGKLPSGHHYRLNRIPAFGIERK